MYISDLSGQFTYHLLTPNRLHEGKIQFSINSASMQKKLHTLFHTKSNFDTKA